MLIDQFAERILKIKNPVSLEVFQGYLITGLSNKNPRCLWINKQNIEGLAEIAKIVTIESAFSAILSLIPGGSFAYRLIKDQIGYPPRYNIIFEPEYYKIFYSFISLDNHGETKGLINGLIQSVDQVTKYAIATTSKLHEGLSELITKNKTKDSKKKLASESKDDIPLGFTYLRFEDITSTIRNRIIKERLNKTESKSMKFAKTATASLSPSVIVSFKTIANEEAKNFLKYAQKIGFNVTFSTDLP